ncbi:hypothetical protein MRX96_048222 [Rhipicephalus microplus]
MYVCNREQYFSRTSSAGRKPSRALPVFFSPPPVAGFDDTDLTRAEETRLSALSSDKASVVVSIIPLPGKKLERVQQRPAQRDHTNTRGLVGSTGPELASVSIVRTPPSRRSTR